MMIKLISTKLFFKTFRVLHCGKQDVYPLIIIYNCKDCHYSGSGGYAPDLSSDPIAFNAITTGGFINTSSPSSSKFYISVTPAYTGQSGQMYPGGPYLSDAEQATILSWITQGASH